MGLCVQIFLKQVLKQLCSWFSIKNWIFDVKISWHDKSFQFVKKIWGLVWVIVLFQEKLSQWTKIWEGLCANLIEKQMHVIIKFVKKTVSYRNYFTTNWIINILLSKLKKFYYFLKWSLTTSNSRSKQKSLKKLENQPCWKTRKINF